MVGVIVGGIDSFEPEGVSEVVLVLDCEATWNSVPDSPAAGA